MTASTSSASSTPPAAGTSTAGASSPHPPHPQPHPPPQQAGTGGHSSSTSAEGWMCPNCAKVFAREDLLRRHLAREARALAQPALDRQKSCYECARSKARCDLETYAPRSGNPNVRRARAQGMLPGAPAAEQQQQQQQQQPLASQQASGINIDSPALAPVSHFGHGAPHHHHHHHHHHQIHHQHALEQQPFYPHGPPVPAPMMPMAQDFGTPANAPAWPAQSPYMVPASQQQQQQQQHQQQQHSHLGPHHHHSHSHQHQQHFSHDAQHPQHHQHPHHHPHHHVGTPGYDSEENIAAGAGAGAGTTGGAGAGGAQGWLDALGHMRQNRAMSVSTIDSINTSSTHHTNGGGGSGDLQQQQQQAPPLPAEYGAAGAGSYPHTSGASHSGSLPAPADYGQHQGFIGPTRTDSPASFLHHPHHHHHQHTHHHPHPHPHPHHQQHDTSMNHHHMNTNSSDSSSSSYHHHNHNHNHHSSGPFPPTPAHQQQPYRRRTSGIVTDLDRSRPGYERDEGEGEDTPIAGPSGQQQQQQQQQQTDAAAGPSGMAATAAALLRARAGADEPRSNSFPHAHADGEGASTDATNRAGAGAGAGALPSFQKSASVGMFDLAAFGGAGVGSSSSSASTSGATAGSSAARGSFSHGVGGGSSNGAAHDPGAGASGPGGLSAASGPSSSSSSSGLASTAIQSLLSPSSHMRPPLGSSTSTKLRNLPSLNTSDTIRAANGAAAAGGAGAGAGGGGGAGPGLNTALRSAIFNSLNTADISRWLEEPVIASPLYRMGPSFAFTDADFGVGAVGAGVGVGGGDPTGAGGLMGLDAQSLMGMGSLGMGMGMDVGVSVPVGVGGVGVDGGANGLAEMTAALSTVAPGDGGESGVGSNATNGPTLSDHRGSFDDGDAQMKTTSGFELPQQQHQQHTVQPQQQQQDQAQQAQQATQLSNLAMSSQQEQQQGVAARLMEHSTDRPVINAVQWWNITQASPSLPQAFVEDLARSCASHFLSYPALLVLADPTAPVPPFMHRAWLAFLRPHTPRALAVARVLLAGHHVRLPTSEDVVWTQIAGEVADLVRSAEAELRAHAEETAVGANGGGGGSGANANANATNSVPPSWFLPGGDGRSGAAVPAATPADSRACLAFASASALWFYVVLIILSDEPASGRHVSLELLNAALCTLSELAKMLAARVRELDEVEKRWKEKEEAAAAEEEEEEGEQQKQQHQQDRHNNDSTADKQARLYRFGYTETLRRTAFACYALLVLQRFREGAEQLQTQLGISAETVLDLGLPAPASVFEAGASPQWERAGDNVWETLKGKRDEADGRAAAAAGGDGAAEGEGEAEGENASANHAKAGSDAVAAADASASTDPTASKKRGNASSTSAPLYPRGAEPHARYTLRDVLDARAEGVPGQGMGQRMAAYLEYADGFTHVCLAAALALDGDLAAGGRAACVGAGAGAAGEGVGSRDVMMETT
ncbi:hypothetical protein OC834_003703 [Tilletia horrida]|nr:hypothetical protein OC834_003703 [Tilletia horrida]